MLKANCRLLITDSSNLPSGCSSPRNGAGDGDDLDFYKSKVKADAKGQLQQTLFDEGLRIAQQYGMSDFAEELKGLKQGSDDSNNAHDNAHDSSNNNGPEDKSPRRRLWDVEDEETKPNTDQCTKAFNLNKSETNSHVAIETS